MEPIMEEKNETIKLPEPSGHVPKFAETSSEVPQSSADFRTVPNHAEAFGKVPQDAERKESHTLTVREVARMFEAAGVARTERSIVNWCQPNRTGIARLDSYFDPNERKYFLTPESVERAIQEEIQRVKKSTGISASEPFGSTVEHVKDTRITNRGNATGDKEFQEMKREIMDLKIANRGKDYLIDVLKSERADFVGQVIQANKKLGELENKILQIENKNMLKI